MMRLGTSENGVGDIRMNVSILPYDARHGFASS